MPFFTITIFRLIQLSTTQSQSLFIGHVTTHFDCDESYAASHSDQSC